MITDLKPYPIYKDSGVSWLGKVPEHWKIERAKWLFRKMDRSVRATDEVVTCFRDGTVTLRKNRRVRGFTESLKEIGYQGIRRGDLVIHAMDAFAGAIGVSDSDGKGTPVYSVCEPKPMANAHYYAQTVREMARSQWIQALAKGIRERSTDFRFEDFGSQSVPLPPVPEQAAAVGFLDYVDRRIRRYIRAKQKLIALLEEQKRAIIHHAVTRGLDPGACLKPSGVPWLGDVPEHWEVVRLGRLITLATGFPFKSEGFTQTTDDIRLLRGINISPGRVRWNDVVRWPAACSQGLTEYELRVGDIVLGMDRPIIQDGIRVAVIKESDIPALLLQRVARIRPHQELLAGFLLLLLAGKSFSNYLTPIFTGISVPHLSPEQIKSFQIALPSTAEQRRIVDQIMANTSSFESAIDRAHREILLLREYRTRLIADVVTGKLDVREAVAHLPDAVDEPESLAEADPISDTEEEAANDLDAASEQVEA
jgi:type I restriction enzyme S subunit